MHEEAPDFKRRRRYEQVNIADLFVPTPKQGQMILSTKAAEGEQHYEALERRGMDGDLESAILLWEKQSAEDLALYLRGWAGRNRARAFAKRTIAKKKTRDEQLAVIRRKVEDLRFYAERQATHARRQAERTAGP